MPSRFFPHPDQADAAGLLYIGGKLSPDWLLDAYSHGIFPWPFEHPVRRRMILGWFSVDPRCILEFDTFHVSRRLERTCRSGRFRITYDAGFAQVIKNCSEKHASEGIWITPEIIDAYIELHRLGYAHSVEAWSDNELAGGVYGAAIGGLFAAESMFYTHRDASKAALVALMRHLQNCGFKLVDIQIKTKHTAQFGAVEIPRLEYLNRLRLALQHTPKAF